MWHISTIIKEASISEFDPLRDRGMGVLSSEGLLNSEDVFESIRWHVMAPARRTQTSKEKAE